MLSLPIPSSLDSIEYRELVAVKGKVLGVLGVRDTLRAESADVIAELKQAGIENFALLTGDRSQPARSVAELLGSIDTIESDMLPLDKANWIEEQTKQGRRVAMVGDGVNDAPALASATVGLALGGVGSDIAQMVLGSDLAECGHIIYPTGSGSSESSATSTVCLSEMFEISDVRSIIESLTISNPPTRPRLNPSPK